MHLLLAITFLIFISGGLIIGNSINDSSEPYMILKTKYREQYDECIKNIPRNKDCVIDTISFKIVDNN